MGKVQLAAPIKGMTNGGRELALVRPFVIPRIENRRFCPTEGVLFVFVKALIILI